MKKTAVAAIIAVFLATGWLGRPASLWAEVDLKTVRELDLKTKPLDVTPSADGDLLFILAPGELLVYSLRQGKITERVPVGKDFDRITASPRGNLITLTSSTKNSLQIVLLEFSYPIAVKGLPFKGPENAPVVVAVFTDYQWPYCARLEPLLQQVLEKNPKNVKLVMKQFPLRSHHYARQAATAALAASKQGKFWEFHEKLYANQKNLNGAKVQEIAQELGLNMEQFNRDLKDPAIGAMINKDMENARQANVRGTPTIFINGKILRHRSLQGFQQAIDEELKKRKK